MSELILAIRAGHNASACIGDATGIRYAIQEERLRGEKNYWGFPSKAIASCLAHVGAGPEDLAEVVSGERQVVLRYHSRDDILHSYARQLEPVGRIRQQVAMPLVMHLAKDYGQDAFRSELAGVGLAGARLSFYDHHDSHAATAYFGLRADRSKPLLVLTCDGSGDGVSATVQVVRDGVSQRLAETEWANSLGAIYAWVTYALGFLPLEHEYKLMGMAAYVDDGVAAREAKLFEEYLGLRPDGLGFVRGHAMPIPSSGPRLISDLRGRRFDYVCAGLQRFTEDLLVRWTRAAVRATGVTDVVVAGGTFMNVKANKRIAELDEVTSFEAFPSCGDETLSLGAYYQAAAKRWGSDRVQPLSDFYLGDDVTEAEAEQAVAGRGHVVERPSEPEASVATVLASGEPVARCVGRMEFGARALGNRSILADPKHGDVVRVINQMVKKRDFWMPFAPVVSAADADRYLVNPKGLRSPYMMQTFDSRANFTEFIAAVHNADLTCRAQIVPRGHNAGYEALLREFEARTGRGVLLNTSFNLHGFPIVRTAAEAVDVFERSGLRWLQVGPYLVRKSG